MRSKSLILLLALLPAAPLQAQEPLRFLARPYDVEAGENVVFTYLPDLSAVPYSAIKSWRCKLSGWLLPSLVRPVAGVSSPEINDILRDPEVGIPSHAGHGVVVVQPSTPCGFSEDADHADDNKTYRAGGFSAQGFVDQDGICLFPQGQRDGRPLSGIEKGKGSIVVEGSDRHDEPLGWAFGPDANGCGSAVVPALGENRLGTQNPPVKAGEKLRQFQKHEVAKGRSIGDHDHRCLDRRRSFNSSSRSSFVRLGHESWAARNSSVSHLEPWPSSCRTSKADKRLCRNPSSAKASKATCAGLSLSPVTLAASSSGIVKVISMRQVYS